MPAKRNRLLVVFRRGPYGSSLPRAGHDLALAAAALEQDVSVLFMDDGVWQLLDNQEASAIGAKTVSRTLASFALYDIDQFFVDAESLLRRGISRAELAGANSLLEPGQLAGFINDFDQVISF